MIEHRLPIRLANYWDRIRNQHPVPSIDMFNPQELDDLWQKCFKVSFLKENGGHIYTYDFIGSELESIFGAGLVGSKIVEKPGFLPIQQMIEQMDKSIHSPLPIALDGQFEDGNGKIIKYRSCLLPFGTSKDNITHFIVGVSWKVY